MKAAKTASPPPRMTAQPMKKVGMTLKTKPLGMGNAKTVGTLTPKAPAVVTRKLKDPAAILESQALRAATVPHKPMVRFRPTWPCQQKRPKEMHQLRKANDPKSPQPPSQPDANNKDSEEE